MDVNDDHQGNSYARMVLDDFLRVYLTYIISVLHTCISYICLLCYHPSILNYGEINLQKLRGGDAVEDRRTMLHYLHLARLDELRIYQEQRTVCDHPTS